MPFLKFDMRHWGPPSGAPEMKDCDTINMVLLRARFYIYRQRLFHKCALDIMQWLKELKHALLFEEYICKMENKVKKFKKWQQLLDVL